MKTTVKDIVIIDDEEKILKSLKRELEPWTIQNRVNIETFTSGNDALDFLHKNSKSVFLVISDLRMPLISGPELLSEISKLYPDIQLYLLTAYSDISEIQNAIKASISRLIFKPWDALTLQQDIEQAFKGNILLEQNRKLEKERAESLRIAGEFQRKLLTSPVSIPGKIIFDLKSHPAKDIECGGDFYDYCKIDNNALLMLGDVSGFGIKSAFITAMLKVLCSANKSSLHGKEIDPSEIMSYLNDGLIKSLDTVKDVLVTQNIIKIDLEHNILTFSTAGNLTIYILREGNILTYENNGPALGFINGGEYENKSFDIQRDDLIIIFTNGLVKSEKSKLSLDRNKIRSILLSLKLDLKPSNAIFEAIKKHHLYNEFTDDVTIITARIV